MNDLLSRTPLNGGERILIAGTEIGRSLTDLADGFRALGFPTSTAILQRNPFQPGFTYDFEAKHPVRLDRIFKTPWKRLRNYPREAAERRHLLSDFDIYVYIFGESLLRKNEDFPILKQRGKRIVSVFCGDDVRHWSAAAPQFKQHGVPYSPHYLEKEGERKLEHQLRKLRMAERYSDVILSQPNQAGLAVRPYHHYFLPVNLGAYTFRAPGRTRPMIAHAPSHRGVKGTDLILAALDELKAEGVGFDLRLFEKTPNEEVVRALSEADLVVDQLYFPLYGFLAMEAMASGCAVAAGNNYAFEPIPAERPIYDVSPAGLKEQLRKIISDPELRSRLGREGRAFVEKHHGHAAVCRYIVDCLSGRIREQHFPEYFAREYRLPDGQSIPPKLQGLTTEIVEQNGVPKSLDVRGLVERGLMAKPAQAAAVWEQN